MATPQEIIAQRLSRTLTPLQMSQMSVDPTLAAAAGQYGSAVQEKPTSIPVSAQLASYLNPQPIVQAPTEQAPTEQAQVDPRTPLGQAIIQSIRGSQQVIPGGVKRTGYQIGQVTEAPMPGTGANEPQGLFASAGGQYGIDPAVAATLDPEARHDYISRVIKAESFPVDVTGLTPRTAYEAAKETVESERQNSTLRESAKAQSAADLFEGRAQDLRTQAEMARSPSWLDADIQRARGADSRNVQPELTDTQRLGMALGAFSVGAGFSGQNAAQQALEVEIRNRAQARQEAQGRLAQLLALRDRTMQNADAMNERAMMLDLQANEARNQEQALIDARNEGLAQEKLSKLQGTQQTVYQDVPARVVGERGGVEGLSKLADRLGLKDQDKTRFMANAMVHGSEAAAKYAVNLQPKPERAKTEADRFDISRRVFVPPEAGIKGDIAWASNPEVAKESQASIANWRVGRYELGLLKQILSRGPELDPDARKEVEVIASRMMGPLRTDMGLGVLSDSDKKLLEPLTGAFTADYVIFNKRKILDRVDDLSRKALMSQLGKLATGPEYNTPLVPGVHAVPVK